MRLKEFSQNHRRPPEKSLGYQPTPRFLRMALALSFTSLLISYTPDAQADSSPIITTDQMYNICLQRSNLPSDPTVWQNKVLTSRIVDADSDIYITDMVTATDIDLTNTPSISELSASFSPDGSRVAFGGKALAAYDLLGNISQYDGLGTVNVDGSNYQQFFKANNPFPKDYQINLPPIWSPDGSKIALIRTALAGKDQLEIMNVDGSSETRFGVAVGNDEISQATITSLDFSPDNKKLAIAVNLSKPDNTDYFAYIFSLNIDGSAIKPIRNPLQPGQEVIKALKWSKDADLISYSLKTSPLESDENSQLFVIPSDGSSLESLLNCQP